MEIRNKEKSWKDKISGLIFEEDTTEGTTGDPYSPGDEKQPSADSSLSTESSTGSFSHSPPGSGVESTAVQTRMDLGSLPIVEIYRNAKIAEDPFSTPEQVLELQATFSDLPLEVQKQKVRKTLSSFKVNIQNVIANTQAKMTAIGGYGAGIQEKAQSTIDTSGQTIVQLQLQIDECRKRIAEAQSLMDQVTQQCQGETRRLQSVLDFLGASDQSNVRPAEESPR